MSRFANAGKLSAAKLNEIVYSRLGVARPDVLLGPGVGRDNAIIDAGRGKVLIVTTDPFWYEPKFGVSDAAWFAWHIVASDIATSGKPPAYVVATYTLPMGSSEGDFATILGVCDREARACGAAIVAGHTAPYASAQYPTIGSMVMMTFAAEGDYVTPALAREGDVVLVTKGAPICAAPMMARIFPSAMRKLLGPALFETAADGMFWESSSLKDSLVAARAGLRTAVTSMHDATEGGVLNGLLEVAEASQVGITIDLDAIPVPEASAVLCDHFRMDPHSAVSLGTLIITVRPAAVTAVIDLLAKEAIRSYRVGEVVPRAAGYEVRRNGRTETVLTAPPDSFWPALTEAVRQGWS